MSAKDLSFSNEDLVTWNTYIKNIQDQDCNIQLVNKLDVMVQSRNEEGGKYTPHLGYQVLQTEEDSPNLPWWNSLIWKISCLLKVKLFIWLSVHNKVLVQDIMTKRYWIMPRLCTLWKPKNKIIDLFILCPYVKRMREHSTQLKRMVLMLKGGNNQDALWNQHDNDQFKDLLVLLALLMWSTWLARNNAMFDETFIESTIYALISLVVLGFFPQNVVFQRSRRIVIEVVDKFGCWAYLYVTSRGVLTTGEVGGILYFHDHHQMQIFVGVGLSSNNC